jgi:hypothetical protein
VGESEGNGTLWNVEGAAAEGVEEETVPSSALSVERMVAQSKFNGIV